jgi:magnesium-transporting ATPase (P-type)
MVWLLNIVFYNLFRFERKTQKFFTYPVLLFLKNKKVRESYKKRGVINPKKEVVKALENPEVGISSILSGGHYMVLFFLLTFGIVNFVSGYLRTEFNLTLAHFAAMAIFSYGFAYLFSFRQDRYLEYFKEFENLPKNKKNKSAWMTFFIVLGVWTFGIGSFVFLNYRL